MLRILASGIALSAVVIGALFLAATAAPSAAQGGAGAEAAFCELNSGRAWEIRRFITPRVQLYSMEGAPLAAVSRDDLSGVANVVQCDNTNSFVKMNTQFGPRLARRGSLVLGGGFGPPCDCPGSTRLALSSNSQIGASSMGAADRPICNADLPCRN